MQVWRSAGTLTQRVMALLHLWAYGVYPLLLLQILLAPVMVFLETTVTSQLPAWLLLFSISNVGFALGFPLVQLVQGRRWSSLPLELGVALVLGVGLSISNSVSVAEGLLLQHTGEFHRTPKSGSQQRPVSGEIVMLAEVALFLWLCFWCYQCILAGANVSVLLPSLFHAVSCLVISLWQLAECFPVLCCPMLKHCFWRWLVRLRIWLTLLHA
jgi:uncharacterized membrane-anchored protein